MKHPIKVPPGLFADWLAVGRKQYSEPALLAGFVAEKAAEWAADQQLMGVNNWIRAAGPYKGVRNELSIVRLDSLATELWAAMRPKPPSLKEQALADLDVVIDRLLECGKTVPLSIRRAIESIPDADS
jgi:hypothetical protein